MSASGQFLPVGPAWFLQSLPQPEHRRGIVRQAADLKQTQKIERNPTETLEVLPKHGQKWKNKNRIKMLLLGKVPQNETSLKKKMTTSIARVIPNNEIHCTNKCFGNPHSGESEVIHLHVPQKVGVNVSPSIARYL